MGEPAFTPDITRPEAAKAGGGDLAALDYGVYKEESMRVMAAGPAVVVSGLFDDVRPGRLNWRPAWAVIAFMLSRMYAGEIIERI